MISNMWLHDCNIPDKGIDIGMKVILAIIWCFVNRNAIYYVFYFSCAKLGHHTGTKGAQFLKNSVSKKKEETANFEEIFDVRCHFSQEAS